MYVDADSSLFALFKWEFCECKITLITTSLENSGLTAFHLRFPFMRWCFFFYSLSSFTLSLWFTVSRIPVFQGYSHSLYPTLCIELASFVSLLFRNFLIKYLRKMLWRSYSPAYFRDFNLKCYSNETLRRIHLSTVFCAEFLLVSFSVKPL